MEVQIETWKSKPIQTQEQNPLQFELTKIKRITEPKLIPNRGLQTGPNPTKNRSLLNPKLIENQNLRALKFLYEFV